MPKNKFGVLWTAFDKWEEAEYECQAFFSSKKKALEHLNIALFFHSKEYKDLSEDEKEFLTNYSPYIGDIESAESVEEPYKLVEVIEEVSPDELMNPDFDEQTSAIALDATAQSAVLSANWQQD